MKKIILCISLITIITMMLGCSNNCDQQESNVKGETLFNFGDDNKVVIRIGGQEKEIVDTKKVEALQEILNELTLSKIEAPEEKAGGIEVSFINSQKEVNFGVCGTQIKYDGKYYLARKDISSTLSSY